MAKGSKPKADPQQPVGTAKTGEASRKRSPRATDPDPTADHSRRATTRQTYERRNAANRAEPGDPATVGGAAGSPTDSGGANGARQGKAGGRTGKGANAGSWKPGQSGNPKGAPRRGESWREMVKSVGDKTLAEALERYPWLASKVPDEIKLVAGAVEELTLKEVVVANVFGRLLEEPDSALWNGLMNRAEGNPEQPVERTWKAELAEWLRDGKVSMDEIKGRLSDELYDEFTVYLGAAIPGAR